MATEDAWMKNSLTSVHICVFLHLSFSVAQYAALNVILEVVYYHRWHTIATSVISNCCFFLQFCVIGYTFTMLFVWVKTMFSKASIYVHTRLENTTHTLSSGLDLSLFPSMKFGHCKAQGVQLLSISNKMNKRMNVFCWRKTENRHWYIRRWNRKVEDRGKKR